MLLASHTVQVTTEAKASPTMTACTTMSAVRNIDQGERSRGKWLLPMTGRADGEGGEAGTPSWACATTAAITRRTTVRVALPNTLPRDAPFVGMCISKPCRERNDAARRHVIT